MAYKNLRTLNEKHHYGNNYLLTILLENIEEIIDADALEKAFLNFQEKYGAPATIGMKKKSWKFRLNILDRSKTLAPLLADTRHSILVKSIRLCVVS